MLIDTRVMVRKQYRRTFIKEWRLFRNLTQEQLADRIGMAPNAISYLERGQSAYTQDTLESVAEALGTDAPTLLRRPPGEEDDDFRALWEEADPDVRRRIVEVARALRRAN